MPAVDMNNENQNPNIVVRTSGLDSYVPTIRRVNESDIKVEFPHQHLTPIEGEPTYETVQNLEEELADNALTAKVNFGGGKKGSLGVVYENTKFRIESGGTDWVVPAEQGAYPTFPANATDDEKKALISEFIRDEYDRKVVEAVEDLLKNQVIEAIDEDYILELKEGRSGYSGITLLAILKHLRSEYATMDDVVYKGLMKRFREPPDMDAPIDKYFRKQQECQLRSQDSDDPVTEKGMVIQLTTHMGETGVINKQVTKFRNQMEATEKTWDKAKKWFRRALKELRDEARLEGADTAFKANAAVKPSTAEAAYNEARDEIAGQMRDSFSVLAASAVTKSDTLDAHAATIASLSNTIAELTSINKKLVAALAAAKQGGRNINPPPGFAADANMTGHSLNALGDSCPTKKWRPDGRWNFVASQFCKTCNNMVKHVPADCPELPGNEKIKEEMARIRASKKARRGKKGGAAATAAAEE